MLLNCMVVSPTMEKIQKHVANFGTAKCMSLMTESVSKLIMLIKKLLGKTGLMGHLANATLTVQTQNVIVKS